MTAVNFGDPLSDVIEEVTVVGNGDHGTRVGRKVLFKPENRFGVQVVGRFVKKQQIGSFNKQTTQSDAAALTTGEHTDLLVRWRASKRIHGLVKLRIDIPRVQGINFGLKLTHLIHQRIKVSIRICHFFRDLVETRKLRESIGSTHANVFDDRLGII